MPITALLATQRSGTHLLSGVLGTHPRVCATPEIFNNSYTARPLMLPGLPFFWEYMETRARSNPALVNPDQRVEVLNDYFDLIQRAAGATDMKVVINIKYNSLHHADGAWRAPCKRPDMIGFLKSRGIGVLHLVRQDHMATALSMFRAQATDVYRVQTGKARTAARFRIDPSALLWRLQLLACNQKQIETWLTTDGPALHTVSYESLFDGEPGSGIRQETLEGIAGFLDVDPGKFEVNPTTVKISPSSYRDELENFGEIEAALRGTEHHDRLLAL